MGKQFFVIIVAVLVVCCSSNPASAQLIEITWTGNGDGMTWEDQANWDGNNFPNAANHVAVFDSVMDTFIELESTVTLFGVCFIHVNNLSLEFGKFEFVGFGVNFETEAKYDNSTVSVNVETLVNLGPNDDTFTIDLSSTEQFGSTNATIGQLFAADGNLIVNAEETDSGLLRFNDSTTIDGDLSIDGTASVGVDQTITADSATITDGDLTLINPTSQLNANSLTLNNGSVTSTGDATATNPFPTLQNNIVSSGGRISLFEGAASFSRGVTIGRGNTLIELLLPLVEQAEFNESLALLSGLTGRTASFRTNGTAQIKFNGVEGGDANGVMPYAIYNNINFAQFDSVSREVKELLNYEPITTANPGDAAQAVGNTTLASDVDVSVLKINSANLDGGGNTITTDALLIKGVNATISNATIMPHHQPGSVVNELFTHAPTGGDRLTLNADIVDNILSTEWTINAPQAGRVTVNNDLSKTGGTNLLGGTLILNADPGGEYLFIGSGGAGLELHTDLPQDVLAGTGPVPAVINVNGDRTISGEVTIEVNSGNDRDFVITATQPDDVARIQGAITRGGTGNPISGQGLARLLLGLPFGNGTIVLEDTFDSTDPGVLTVLDGDGGRDFLHKGQSGSTLILGNVDVYGNGGVDILNFGESSSARIGPGEPLGTFTVNNDFKAAAGALTYEAEIDDVGNSDLLAVGGTLDISTPTDTLVISFFSGNTLANVDYTLATYGLRVGIFDTVIFDGNTIVNPTAAGAIQGTHQLYFGPTALLLTTEVPVLLGDYNDNGVVDAADYTEWLAALGGTELVNDPTPGTVDQSDYAYWKAHFGETLGSGSSSGAAVPEPATAILVLIVLATLANRRRRSPQ